MVEDVRWDVGDAGWASSGWTSTTGSAGLPGGTAGWAARAAWCHVITGVSVVPHAKLT